MKLCEQLKKDNIALKLKGNTRDDVIRELADCLKEDKNVNDFDGFVSAVFVRENMVSTGIGYEVAVPHARTDTVEDVIIAFGRSDEGIDFNSIDKMPVKLIFLIGTPAKKSLSAYIKLLAHLSRLLQKEDLRKRLLEASSPEEILDEFRKVEP